MIRGSKLFILEIEAILQNTDSSGSSMKETKGREMIL